MTIYEAYDKTIESNMNFVIEHKDGSYQHIDIRRDTEHVMNGNFANALDELEKVYDREVTYISFNKADNCVEFSSYLED